MDELNQNPTAKGGAAARHPSVRQRGAAMVESLIALPVIILLLMGAVEWARIYEAKVTADHAVTVAARTGSFNNASPASLYRGLAKGLLPYYAPGKGQWQNTLTRVSQQLVRDSQVRVLNPTREAFQDFGISDGGITYLPNDELHRQSTSLGNNSGLNIQDANLLKVEVTWGLPLRMPVISDLITNFGEVFLASNAFEKQLYARGQLPITSSTALRMQSPVILGDHILSIRDIQRYKRHKGGPTDQLLAGTATGSTVNVNKGYQGITPLVTTPRSDDSGDDDTDGSTNAAGEDKPEGGAEPAPEEPDPEVSPEGEEPDCEEAPREETELEEDADYFETLWHDLKKLSLNAYDFVRGFWEGIKSQISDIYTLVISPVETAEGLYELGKAFLKDPEGTAKLIFDDLYDDFQKVTLCGAYDKGKIVGEYINPVFMLKVATKLTHFSDLAKVVKGTKKELGCASFGAGTEVWGAQRKIRIEDIARGQKVASRSEQGYRDAPQKVTQVFGRVADHHYRLVTESDSILITAEHPVWVQGKGWTAVEKVQPYDVLASVNGDQRVAFVTHVDQPLRVYNFSVAETPSYFVGNGGLWVHNAHCTIPDYIVDLSKQRLDGIETTSVRGLVGEGKVAMILEKQHGMTPLGNKNVNWRNLESEATFNDEYGKYVGSTGIDGIFRGQDGKIYIVESKASGVKEGCKGGSLCKSDDGKQMSRGWLNEERLSNTGIKDRDLEMIMDSLKKGDGEVVRLYAGINKAGETHFYEITDKGGSMTNVVVERQGNEYKFYE